MTKLDDWRIATKMIPKLLSRLPHFLLIRMTG
jgi:hypothetical protein